MSAPTTTPPTISGEGLTELLALIKEADSVELKLTVPESDQRSAVGSARPRPAAGTDPPGLLLRHARAGTRQAGRRRPRPPDPGQGRRLRREAAPGRAGRAAGKLRRSASFRVEVDALPGGFVCSAALKGALRPNDVRSAVAGRAPVAKALLQGAAGVLRRARAEGIALDDLTTLGPIFVLKLRFTPEDLARKLVAEMWLYPDGSRILELSTRCGTDEAFQVAAELRAFLADARRRPLGRAGDEDAQGARLLREPRPRDSVTANPDAGEASPPAIVPRWEWRTFGESFGRRRGAASPR